MFATFARGEDIRKEREKARRLRASGWWKRKRETGLCHFCGRRVAPSELTMEHKIPLSRGGKSTRENLVPACKDCNNRKKYLLPIEWEEYLEKLAHADDDTGG